MTGPHPASMEYRTLGRAGCVVSSFAIGTSNFGRDCVEDDAHRILDAFVEAGGTLIDTSDTYQQGLSEEIVGRWLRARPPEWRRDLVVATKGRGPTWRGPNGSGLSRKHLVHALEDSLRRLGVDCVDLYQLHAPDPTTPIEETLEFLTRAVDQGKVLYVGGSNFHAWELQRAVDVAESRSLTRFVTVQSQYSLLARELEYEILPAARANGVGVLVWSPLARGWLSGKYSRSEHPRPGTRLAGVPADSGNSYAVRSGQSRTWDLLDVVAGIAAEHGVSSAQVALSWVHSQPGVCSVIVGARRPQQLVENLAAGEVVLEQSELDRLRSASEPERHDYPYGALAAEQHVRTVEPSTPHRGGDSE